jgi:histidine triad (HIT) family protein
MFAGMSDQDCLFCKIVTGDVPADVVHQSDSVLAFRDIEPQAPVHVLVIPRNHHENAAEVAGREPDVWVEMANVAAAVAEKEGLDAGYRLVLNTGREANQLVMHAHLHVLGGRSMGWPPG